MRLYKIMYEIAIEWQNMIEYFLLYYAIVG